MPSAGVVIVSEMRFPGRPGDGGLAAVDLRHATEAGAVARQIWPPRADFAAAGSVDGDPSCTAPPAKLSPHGLTSAAGTGGRVRLAIVGHDEREAVELFDLDGLGDDVRLAWRGCVPLPPGTSGNDLAIAPDGEIVVSNFQPDPPSRRTFAVICRMSRAAIFGTPTGDLIAWRRDGGWRHLAGTAAALPNGVAVSPDGATVYFAESGANRVRRVARRGATDGAASDAIVLPGSPDNLSWTDRGTLLVGTHLSNLAIARCSFGETPCCSPWGVWEIDPKGWTAKEVFRHDGKAVGAVASAARVGDLTFVGPVYDDRIGVFR